MFRVVIILFCALFFIQPCFASDKELKHSWTYYKSTFISKDGRVIDFEKKSITTSEGQSYAMLRAVMIGDKQTFKSVYSWTKTNLKRTDDNLFAWLWGEKDGKYGQLDPNSATDADIDIAFSLILASKKWKNPCYLEDAKKIIGDIWQYETVLANGKRILSAGYLQSQKEIIDVNPSYFAPYVFRVFAKYDDNDWNKLINDNYELLKSVINSTTTKLPPDWLTVNKTNGEFTIDKQSAKSDFSYDASRTFMRVYLDYLYTKDKRAEKIIENTNFFVRKFNNSGKFYTNVKENGEYRDLNESNSSIGIIFPVITHINKNTGNSIYKAKIATQYNKLGYWGNLYDYYSQNLVWFGNWIYFKL